MEVNYITHLNAWFTRIYEDDKLHSSHVALYLALFQYWNLSRFNNPITIFREEVMRFAKIGSKTTYTKCMKELDQWGYIEYRPSFNPMRGSKVRLYTFGKGDEKGNSKASVKVAVPYIKQKKQVKPTNSDVNQNKNFDEPL